MAVQSKENQRTQAHHESDVKEHTQGRRSTSGRGWHGDPAGHAEAGRKGGLKVAGNREHMAQIGKKGGEAVSRDRQHMAEIGRKGGQARSENGSARE